ncbi:MAG: ABC transporter ATP-binding protein [Aggregatilineales bacterium]|nr:ABC transporter ATP-binding protein [Chloroflexota bacterium]HOA23246.1 ABC transporter ATP-binding protein [Aggregatilineales bacterium]HPV05494.1 ABC transporter ATP-binding protein [Aggregatilineales bacterium]HQE18025.1 ABC transporter ATP-binding protein [Aggregatilineales bacterium]
MSEPGVELRNVVKRFGTGQGSVVAVNGVSLSIRDGEFFSLLGPSGCGKTTTLRMIGGFETPTEGEIYIAGEPQGYKPAYRRPVNTVFQHYALFPHMTVFNNVAFGLQMQGVDRDEIKRRVEEALDMVQMGSMADRKPHQLSGGQQQRVALARALVNHPKVLLLDEPLGALDYKLRKAMQFELKRLQERVGITFVYVTHDQEEALTMSDRIGVMHRGRLLQVGTAQEIYEAPMNRFVANFIGETNYLRGKVVELAGKTTIGEITMPVVKVLIEPDTCILTVGTPDLRPGDAVTVAFRPEKIRIVDECDGLETNCANGVVADLVYKGAATTYLIRLAGGEQIKVDQQNTRAMFDTLYHPGEQVTITWPIAGCKAFAEEAEEDT